LQDDAEFVDTTIVRADVATAAITTATATATTATASATAPNAVTVIAAVAATDIFRLQSTPKRH
jgi:hypothetical protein